MLELCAAALVVLGGAPSAHALGCLVVPFADQKLRAAGGPTAADTGKGLVDRVFAAPGEFVTLSADFGCLPASDGFSAVPSENLVTVEVQSENGNFAVLAAAASDIQVLDCPPGLSTRCSTLKFRVPATGDLVAGPARIRVVRNVAGTSTTVIDIFRLLQPTAACTAEDNDGDGVPDALHPNGGFVVLPSYNVLQEGVPQILKAAKDHAGNVLTPIDNSLILRSQPGAPLATLTESRSLGIDLTPNTRFLSSLSPKGLLIPPILELVDAAATLPSGSFTKKLVGSTDVLRSVTLLRDADPSDPSITYPLSLATLRTGAGPIIPPGPSITSVTGAAQLVSLRSSAEQLCVGLSEAIVGDQNGDGDTADQVGQCSVLVAPGDTVSTGLAMSQIAGSARRTASVVDGDLWAFLESENDSAYGDLTGEGSFGQNGLRVFRGITPLTPGVPPFLQAVDPGRAVDGRQLAISADVVFFRTPEQALVPSAVSRVSELASGIGGDADSGEPSIDASGSRVAFESRATNFAAATHQDIYVKDRGSSALLLAAGTPGNGDSFAPSLGADGSQVAWESDANDFVTLTEPPGASQQVVWERGTSVSGVIHESGGFFPDAALLFDLEPGEAFPGAGDWSPCTATLPGIELIFADDPGFAPTGTFEARLLAGPDPACTFDVSIVGSFASSTTPITTGTVITLVGNVASSMLVPGLPPEFTNRAFQASLIVGTQQALGYDADGVFDMVADLGAGASSRQVYAAPVGGPVAAVSVDAAGVAGDGDSRRAAISGDGRFVAFDSDATNLVPADTNGASDVFVHDRDADGNGVFDEPGGIATVRVSVRSDGSQAGGGSHAPAITPDGRFVVFDSLAGDLVAGDTNGARDVFVHDRDADGNGVFDEPGGIATARVSLAAGGAQAPADSFDADLSDDGRFVVFTSQAALLADDGNALSDVYLLDRADGILERVSVDSGKQEVAVASGRPALSGDGRFVVFESDGLVPFDTPGTDVYRFDRINGAIERADGSGAPDASGDGLVVAFHSDAGGLPQDVFVRAPVAGVAPSLNDLVFAPDTDTVDTVLQAFDAIGGSFLPGARIAASRVSSAAGIALVQVPEAEQGNANLNDDLSTLLLPVRGDTDAQDEVAFLYRAADDRLRNLGVAIRDGGLSAEVVCLAVSEADENATPLDGDGLANESVLVWGPTAGLLDGTGGLTNSGIAVREAGALGSFCVFTAPESADTGDLNGDGDLQDDVLGVLDTRAGLPYRNVAMAAQGFQLGPERRVAFPSPEAAQGATDANGDGDAQDVVPFVVDLLDLGPAGGPVPVVNLGRAWTPCDVPACGAFDLASIRTDGTVSWTGFESDNRVSPSVCRKDSPFGRCDTDGNGRETRVVFTAKIEAGAVAAVQALLVEPTQQTSIFPETVVDDTLIGREMTECQAAEIKCRASGFVLPSPLPATLPAPPGSCEADLDLTPNPIDGLLNCDASDPAALILFIDGDFDGDGVPNVTDNAKFVANPDQLDADGDGVGAAAEFSEVTLLPGDRNCDMDFDGDVDQLDVDVVTQSLDQPAQGSELGISGGDQRDRDRDGVITVLDVSACVAQCTLLDCAVVSSLPAAPPPGSSEPLRSGCGLLGIEALLPLGFGAWRRRRRAGRQH